MNLKRLAILIIGVIALLCTSAPPAAAEVVYHDKHGIKMEYRFTDTRQQVFCDSRFKDGPDYTPKKIKIWKATVTLTNGSGKRIRPQVGGSTATINVEEDKGSSLDYCSYSRIHHLWNVGYPDQGGLPFGVSMFYPINPGKSLSNSVYLYLYEDRKPVMTRWDFSGYRFAEDKKNKPKKPQQTAKRTPTAQNVPPSTPSRQTPRPSRGPSGSLLLLIDVSGSMDGTKLSSAKRAAVDTIRKAIKNKTEIAVLAFEGDCTSPLNNSIGFTRNEAELVAFVNGLDAQGGTPLATALEATNRFMRQHKSAASRTQMILLLADGDDDCGGLNQVLSRLKQNNLLYRHETVGLEVSGAAQRQLKNIATQSGGKYHSATSQNLSKVFSDAVDLMRMLDMIGKFN